MTICPVLATRGLFYVPLASLATLDWEHRCSLFQSFQSSLPVRAGFSIAFPHDLILQLQHPFSSQWHWLDLDLNLLFAPTLTSDVNLLNLSTDVARNELPVAAGATLTSLPTLSVTSLYQCLKHQSCKRDDLLKASISLFSWGLLNCFPSSVTGLHWATSQSVPPNCPTLYLQCYSVARMKSTWLNYFPPQDKLVVNPKHLGEVETTFDLPSYYKENVSSNVLCSIFPRSVMNFSWSS